PSSYASLPLTASAKILGFEVRPLTENSLIYRASVPSSRMAREILSSHRLWPMSCSFRVVLMRPPVCSVAAYGRALAPARHAITGEVARTAQQGWLLSGIGSCQ